MKVILNKIIDVSQRLVDGSNSISSRLDSFIFSQKEKNDLNTSLDNILESLDESSFTQYINSFVFNSNQGIYMQPEYKFIIINNKLYYYDYKNNQLILIDNEIGWTCVTNFQSDTEKCFAIKNNILYMVTYGTTITITQIQKNIIYVCGPIDSYCTVSYALGNNSDLYSIDSFDPTLVFISNNWNKICGCSYYENGGGKTCGFGIKDNNLYVLSYSSSDIIKLTDISGWKFVTGTFSYIFYSNVIQSYGWAIDLNGNLYYLTDEVATRISGIVNCRFVYSMDLFTYAITDNGLYYINNLNVSKIDADPNWTHINNKIGIKNNKLYYISGSEISPLQMSMNWTDISMLSIYDSTALAVGNGSLYKINNDKSMEKIFE